MAKCKSPRCSAIISFVKTSSGRLMPVDPGLKTILDPQSGEVHKGFTPHKITCKDLDFFDKKKRKS